MSGQIDFPELLRCNSNNFGRQGIGDLVVPICEVVLVAFLSKKTDSNLSVHDGRLVSSEFVIPCKESSVILCSKKCMCVCVRERKKVRYINVF